MKESDITHQATRRLETSLSDFYPTEWDISPQKNRPC